MPPRKNAIDSARTGPRSLEEEFHRTRSDLKNLLESLQLATLFLDGALRIREFSAGIDDILRILPSDRGRPIGEVRSRLAYGEVEADCRRVLRTLSIIERDVYLADRRAHYAMRISPYRTIDNAIDGVVVTFLDVTERKLREAERALLAAVVGASNDAILSVSLDGRIASWNAGAERLYGYAAEEAIGRPLAMLIPPDRAGELSLIDERAKAGDRIDDLETVQLTKSGRRADVSLSLSPIRDATGRIVSLAVVASDIADRKRTELQRVMMAELNHRVKNSLAVVTALARRTLRSSPSPEAFVAAFEGRLKAFGRTHNALSQENWSGIPLAQLVESELKPYKGRHRDRASARGPKVLLRPRAALTLAMTIHELASNAVKFGALSDTTGRVELSWTLDRHGESPKLVLVWRESGGPPVTPPAHSGLGRKLIEQMLAYELGAAVRLTFAPEGAQCVIAFALTPQVGEIPTGDGQTAIAP